MADAVEQRTREILRRFLARSSNHSNNVELFIRSNEPTIGKFLSTSEDAYFMVTANSSNINSNTAYFGNDAVANQVYIGLGEGEINKVASFGVNAVNLNTNITAYCNIYPMTTNAYDIKGWNDLYVNSGNLQLNTGLISYDNAKNAISFINTTTTMYLELNAKELKIVNPLSKQYGVLSIDELTETPVMTMFSSNGDFVKKCDLGNLNTSIFEEDGLNLYFTPERVASYFLASNQAIPFLQNASNALIGIINNLNTTVENIPTDFGPISSYFTDIFKEQDKNLLAYLERTSNQLVSVVKANDAYASSASNTIVSFRKNHKLTLDNIAIGTSNKTIINNIYDNDLIVSNIVVNGNVIPYSNMTFDLGSPTRKWADVFLSGNSIYLADTIISADDNNIVFKDKDHNLVNVITTEIKILEDDTIIRAENSNIKMYCCCDKSTDDVPEGALNSYFKHNLAAAIIEASNVFTSNFARLSATNVGMDDIADGIINKLIINNRCKDLFVNGTLTTCNLNVVESAVIANTLIYETDEIDVKTGLKIVQAGNQPLIRCLGSEPLFTVNHNGNVAIGNIIPREKLHVLGNIHFASNINSISSHTFEKMKNIKAPIQQQLNDKKVSKQNTYWNNESQYTYFGQNVGIRTNLPRAQLHVGYSPSNIGGIFENAILGKNAVTFADDSRMKRNIEDVDKALDKLMKIKPQICNDSGPRFIGQQVYEVIPDAVYFQTTFIPNIQSYAVCYSNVLKLSSNISNLGTGTKIKVVDENGEEYVCKVQHSDTEYVSVDKDLPSGEVFVYGTEVDDFHTLNENSIYSLNICATQTLARQLKSLEEKVAQIKSHISY